VWNFTIITGPPNKLVVPIHNRMPVILPPSHWRAYSVNVRIGNVRNNDAALIEPVALAS
jgi:putative SOS response-associated peptidase YedK